MARVPAARATSAESSHPQLRKRPMHVFHGYENFPSEFRGASLAIGNFDGVHRGHQALIARARDRAAAPLRYGAPKLAGAMVFEPHPREFFHPERPHFRLTSLDRKLALFERYGLEQQGEIVRHTFLLRRGFIFPGAPPLATLESILPFKGSTR